MNSIKQVLDAGAEISLPFKMRIRDYPSNVAIFKMNGKYCVFNREIGDNIESEKFNEAWDRFKEFMDPKKNPGVAFKLTLDTIEDGNYSDNALVKKVARLVKKKGYATTFKKRAL